MTFHAFRMAIGLTAFIACAATMVLSAAFSIHALKWWAVLVLPIISTLGFMAMSIVLEWGTRP